MNEITYYTIVVLIGIVITFLLRGQITNWPQYVIGWLLVLVIEWIVKKIRRKSKIKKIEYVAIDYETTHVGQMEYRTVCGNDRRANGPLLLRQLKGTNVVEWSYEGSAWSKEGIPGNIARMFFDTGGGEK